MCTLHFHTLFEDAKILDMMVMCKLTLCGLFGGTCYLLLVFYNHLDASCCLMHVFNTFHGITCLSIKHS